jgi:hypothetical protein
VVRRPLSGAIIRRFGSRGGEVKSELRKPEQRLFEPFLYRFQGVGEGVFGGIKTQLDGPVRECEPRFAIKRALLKAICDDVHILLTLSLFALQPCFVRQAHVTSSSR